MAGNQYRQIKSPINSNMIVVQNNEYKWGVINPEGEVVIPFGKYAWIDGFQNGLAKVIAHGDTTSPNLLAVFDDTLNLTLERISKQGIINEDGSEVLPTEYNVWKFYGKKFPTIKYYKGSEGHTISYEALNPKLYSSDNDYSETYDSCYDDTDYMSDTWDAMTDGMYGDMPEGFDGDFSFLGY